MKSMSKCSQLAAISAALAMFSAGCQQASNESTEPATTTPDQAANADDVSHSGWWCVEHAIPEEECSMCSVSAAARFKEQGDWCDEHNRAESQCFKCDPSRAEKYVKLYEAKYGQTPDPATD